DAFHFLGLHQLFLRFLQRDLRLPALADIARDLGEANQLAALVGDAIDHHAGPETRTVLAHAPALRLEFSAAGGGGECPLRRAGVAILLTVKTAVMLTDDLLGAIALDALRARIPVADDPVGIEHEHGVVADAIDQQLEAPLRLMPLLGL